MGVANEKIENLENYHATLERLITQRRSAGDFTNFRYFRLEQLDKKLLVKSGFNTLIMKIPRPDI